MPEASESDSEFIKRRSAPLDREAIRHRLTLLDQSDPRPIARQVRVPVRYLAGFIDPLVPWMLVRLCLRRNCPAYLGGRTFWFADHNVLATSPTRAANLVIDWMKSGNR